MEEDTQVPSMDTQATAMVVWIDAQKPAGTIKEKLFFRRHLDTIDNNRKMCWERLRGKNILSCGMDTTKYKPAEGQQS